MPLAVSERRRFGVMVGRSVAIRTTFAQMERAAACDATVFIDGETGSGKEAAAESIHRESRRREGPFVVVDCGAIPTNLLESELFGHERGSFTSAVAARKGAFELAHGGTIFLDEIGELTPELQPKLLRVLETREVKRVGNTSYMPVDVRVIAATNRNLRQEVRAGRFRSDLYYRMAVLLIRIPPLRERVEDLPLLIEHFAGSASCPFLREPKFETELARHEWPGNVRELRNYLERCVALGEPAPFDHEWIEEEPAPTSPLVPLKLARERAVREFEARYLSDALRHFGDNVAAAARAAGVDRMYFYRLLWRHGLREHHTAKPPR